MKKNFISLFLLFSVICKSQSNFQRKLFKTASTGTVAEVVYSNEYNTSTFIIENLIGTSQFTGFSTITKFTTTTGNITSSKTFSISGYDLAIKKVIKNNQMLYIIASLTNSVTKTGCIIKYNLSSNTTVWRRTLTLNESSYILSAITYDSDKYLYALGAGDTINASNNLFVLKLDTNGTFIWNKAFGEPTVAQKPCDILYNGKKELYVTSMGDDGISISSISLRLDSSGIILNSSALLYNGPMYSGFDKSFSAILNRNLVKIETTFNLVGSSGDFLIRSLDTNLNTINTKILNGLYIKSINGNKNNLLINGIVPINSGLKGFRTIRFDTLLNLSSRHFNKINLTSDTVSATCFINSSNNSFHFFKSNISDTVIVTHTDIYESVGCLDTAYVPGIAAISYTALPYTFTTSSITSTLSTITLPIGSATYSSSLMCSMLTTDIHSISNSDIISIYPNPANYTLFIESQNYSISKFIVSDIDGRELIENTLLQSVDISNLQQGIYFLSLYDANKRLVGVKKFIKD